MGRRKNKGGGGQQENPQTGQGQGTPQGDQQRPQQRDVPQNPQEQRPRGPPPPAQQQQMEGAPGGSGQRRNSKSQQDLQGGQKGPPGQQQQMGGPPGDIRTRKGSKGQQDLQGGQKGPPVQQQQMGGPPGDYRQRKGSKGQQDLQGGQKGPPVQQQQMGGPPGDYRQRKGSKGQKDLQGDQKSNVQSPQAQGGAQRQPDQRRDHQGPGRGQRPIDPFQTRQEGPGAQTPPKPWGRGRGAIRQDSGPPPQPAPSVGSPARETPSGPTKPAWGQPAAAPFQAKAGGERTPKQPAFQPKPQSPESSQGSAALPTVQEAPKQAPKQGPKQGPKSPQKGQGAGKKQDRGDGKDVGKLGEKLENLLIMEPRKSINQKDKPGRRMMVGTNHLPIAFKNKNVIAYHYDVTFDPDKPKYLFRKAWNEFATRFFPNRFPSFDGKKNVYSNGPLPGVGEGSMTQDIEVFNEESQRNKSFKITIQNVNQIDLSEVLNYVGARDLQGTNYPRNAMQVIDIVLRNLPANQLVQSGRLFFSPPPGQIYSLGDGLDLWYGFHQSAILGWKPYLNVDIAHKGFPTPCGLLKTLEDVFNWDNSSELNPKQEANFLNYIKRLKVEYQIPGVPSSKRTYRVNSRLGVKASSLSFTLDNGTTTTVAKYYETVKNYKLKHPYLPCLWVGSTAKKIYVPIELCKVVEGQVVNGKMNERQTSNMVKEAAKGTEIRKKRIMQQIKQAEYNTSPYAEEFGVSVAGEFEKVEARKLDPPRLIFHKNRSEQPKAGVWSNSRNPVLLHTPVQLKDWCVICLDNRTKADKLLELENMLMKTAKEQNMNPERPVQAFDSVNPRDLEKVLQNLKEKQVRIVFVVVPDSGTLYSKVKKISELRLGLLTQCLKASTVFRKLNAATLNNILLKVNAKLNGVNLILDPYTRPTCFSRPVMIVGADVTHPSPDSENIPSVAAVAASHDANGFQYNMIQRYQDPKDEMIRDLEIIMKEQLKFFYQKTNKLKPEKIIFYRDGVSDGQIQQVFNIEFQAIRRACASIEPGYNPGITFVVVQKRHHTRFFPDKNDPNLDDNRNYNVPAGTCVDTNIVHPRETEFYLVSHAAIQGTSRPTKYRLVWDDNNLGEVELEKLTYHLCHLFSRCTRSVSYPAPTYNAHLAAFRGRVYLEEEIINLKSLEQEQSRRKIHDDIRRSAPMHFV